MPIAEVRRRALVLTPQQELPELQDRRAVTYPTRGLLLYGLGIVPDRTHATFTLKPDAEPAFTLDFPGFAPRAATQLIPTATAMGLVQQNPGKLIIDMRDNGGDDNTVGYSALVQPLMAHGA